MSEQEPTRSRSSRANRGNRMKALIENAKLEQEGDADEEFWNQDFFQEATNDDHYSTEEESEDKIDDDFYDSEPDTDDEGENEASTRRQERRNKIQRNKRSNIYQDPKKAKKAKRESIEKVPAVTNEELSDLPLQWNQQCRSLSHWRVSRLRRFAKQLDLPIASTKNQLINSIQRKHIELHKNGDELPDVGKSDIVEKAKPRDKTASGVRASTKSKSESVQALLVARKADAIARRAARRKLPQLPPPKPLTREERLAEAKLTEDRNAAELAAMIAEHDKQRKKQATGRIGGDFSGPRLLSISSEYIGSRLSFSDPPSQLFPNATPSNYKPTPVKQWPSTKPEENAEAAKQSNLISVLSSSRLDTPVARRSTPRCQYTKEIAKYQTKDGVPVANLKAYKMHEKVLLKQKEEKINAELKMFSSLLHQARQQANHNLKKSNNSLPSNVAAVPPSLTSIVVKTNLN